MSQRIQQKIDEYQQLVAQQEQEVATLERECAELRDELSDFEKRYNQLIKPLTMQLDAIKAAVRSLEDLQTKQLFEGIQASVDSLWQSAPYIEVQEEPTQPSADEQPDDTDDEATYGRRVVNSKTEKVKALYRQLARRFHPDYATDHKDRLCRTKLMVLINKAYQEEDLETLQSLDDEDTPATSAQASTVNAALSLATLELRHLQQRHQALTIKIRDLKLERSDLRYGSMMELKIEEKMARVRGEDLLAKLAEELRDEYWGYVSKLDALREKLK